MFEASGSHGSETGLLLSRAVGEEARNLHGEDEAQDRFDKRQTYLQQETWNGRAGLWKHLLDFRVGSIYRSREEESKHSVATLLCGSQSIESASLWPRVWINGAIERVIRGIGPET